MLCCHLVSIAAQAQPRPAADVQRLQPTLLAMHVPLRLTAVLHPNPWHPVCAAAPPSPQEVEAVRARAAAAGFPSQTITEEQFKEMQAQSVRESIRMCTFLLWLTGRRRGAVLGDAGAVGAWVWVGGPMLRMLTVAWLEGGAVVEGTECCTSHALCRQQVLLTAMLLLPYPLMAQLSHHLCLLCTLRRTPAVRSVPRSETH